MQKKISRLFLFKNSLTFGSNFGYHSHFKSLIKLKKIQNNFIYSPKAHIKLDLNKKFLINKKQIKKTKFDLISIATPPKIQKKICIENMKKTKYFFLEKPLTENYKETLKLLKSFKKNKIKFFLNFIFPNIINFQIFKNLIKKKKITYGLYVWKFKQGYFKNRRVNWKIKNSEGGGLIDFYLIHVFYNLLFLIGEFKIKKIIYKKEKILKKILIFIQAKNNFQIKIDININSNSNLHKISFADKKNRYEIINKSKNWVQNFNVYKNNIMINKDNNIHGRDDLTYINLKKFLEKKDIKKEKKFFELAHFYCDEINRWSKKQKY